MKLEHMKIGDLIPYINNSRTHSEGQISQIAASIREFGFTNPILVDEKKNIIAGHGRLAAARKLGIEEVPTIVLEGLSDTKRKALIVADNSLALNAGWDLEVLKLELGALHEENFDIDLLGFDDDFLKSLENIDSNISNPETGNNQDLYTTKIEVPIYEPTGEKPKVSELFDLEKFNSLKSEIEKKDLPEEIKSFLNFAAHRHIIFNYQNIAEYYAHAPKDVQELMENSALVIIDFNKAIENGFVKMSQEIATAYFDE